MFSQGLYNNSSLAAVTDYATFVPGPFELFLFLFLIDNYRGVGLFRLTEYTERTIGS